MADRGRRRGRERSTRSYVVGLVLAVVVVGAMYVWMTNGGPEAFGTWFADYFSQR